MTSQRPHSAGQPTTEVAPKASVVGDALTTNDRRVIIERHLGWEKARPGLLADVFGVSRQMITATLNAVCAVCRQPICDHRDSDWHGSDLGRGEFNNMGRHLQHEQSANRPN